MMRSSKKKTQCKGTTELDVIGWFPTGDAAVDVTERPADSVQGVQRFLQQWHLAKEGEDVAHYLQGFSLLI